MLLRAAFVRKPTTADPNLTPSLLRAERVQANPQQLAKFREVCSFTDNGYLPISFPQIMSTALQIQLMLEAEFPFSPIGVVHVRNSIEQYRPIANDARIDLSVQTRPLEITPNGYEFSFLNQASVGGDVCWQSTATILVPRKLAVAKPAKREHKKGRDYDQVEQWRIPGNRGRRYAKASGDYNPIHLYTSTAKLLGFRRHIAHGMWSKSRCIADLWNDAWEESWEDAPNQVIKVDAAFKLPVYLPATVTMMSSQEGSTESVEIPFELRGPTGRRPHLIGHLSVSAAKAN